MKDAATFPVTRFPDAVSTDRSAYVGNNIEGPAQEGVKKSGLSQALAKMLVDSQGLSGSAADCHRILVLDNVDRGFATP